jgi:hypothetical protein
VGVQVEISAALQQLIEETKKPTAEAQRTQK